MHNTSPHPLYPHVFTPIQVGHLTLPNRILMGSMHTGLEEDKGGFHKMARYFAERAEGGVAMMVTGGVSPNREGWLSPFAIRMTHRGHVRQHQKVTGAVHESGGRICMQILHAGRYGYHPLSVAPSAIKAPITPFKPRALSGAGVKRTIRHYVRAAQLAQQSGYDGVEVMGSEGYLINEFLVSATNHRKDQWGGTYENRMRFPIEIVKQIRAAVGPEFVIIYRLSMLDLVPGGSSWEEIVELAKRIEEAGASVINTGIGWHEARVPTIATMVPRGGFAWVTAKMMGEVNIPLIATNRINTPDKAEAVLADGMADMVSMARPFLADPDFVNKAKDKQPERINTCIACNQACLDHIFKRKTASCLVNPRACHETEKVIALTAAPKKVAVVGGGAAGMSAAMYAAQAGHKVSLFERSKSLGGQFNLARVIPGKEEFHETMRYFSQMLEELNVDIRLNTTAEAKGLKSEEFDHVVLATGVTPRKLDLPGAELPHVVAYDALLNGEVEAGERVAIIGAGGIGFDVAEYLLHSSEAPRPVDEFLDLWNVDALLEHRGGLKGKPKPHPPKRQITLLQRKEGKLGAGLGKTTGWIHRASLKMHKVSMLSGVSYKAIVPEGLEIERQGKTEVVTADTVVVCAGQLSVNGLAAELGAAGLKFDVIGGAKKAGELDAKRAISEGFWAASQLDVENADM